MIETILAVLIGFVVGLEVGISLGIRRYTTASKALKKMVKK